MKKRIASWGLALCMCLSLLCVPAGNASRAEVATMLMRFAEAQG